MAVKSPFCFDMLLGLFLGKNLSFFLLIFQDGALWSISSNLIRIHIKCCKDWLCEVSFFVFIFLVESLIKSPSQSVTRFNFLVIEDWERQVSDPGFWLFVLLSMVLNFKFQEFLRGKVFLNFYFLILLLKMWQGSLFLSLRIRRRKVSI